MFITVTCSSPKHLAVLIDVRFVLCQPQVQNELSRQTLQDVYDPCFLLPLFSCLLASS